MGIAESFKGKKGLIILAGISLSVIVIFIIVQFGSSGKKSVQKGPEVISKRAKVVQANNDGTEAKKDASKTDALNVNAQQKTEEKIVAPIVEPLKPIVPVEPMKAPVSAPAAAKTEVKSTAAPQAVKSAPVVSPQPKAEAVKKVAPAQKAPEPKKAEAQAAPKKTAPVKAAEVEKEKPRSATKTVERSTKSGAPNYKKADALPWAVSLASYATEEEANAAIASLGAAGYNAYITEFNKDGRLWRRVRIGFYRTQEDAQKAADNVKKKYSLQSPWTVRPTRLEVASHIK